MRCYESFEATTHFPHSLCLDLQGRYTYHSHPSFSTCPHYQRNAVNTSCPNTYIHILQKGEGTDCHGTFCKRKKWNPATLVPDLPYQIFLLCALRRCGLQLIHRSNDLTYKATIRFSAETLPFHTWFTVTVLNLLYIEHGSSGVRVLHYSLNFETLYRSTVY